MARLEQWVEMLWIGVGLGLKCCGFQGLMQSQSFQIQAYEAGICYGVHHTDVGHAVCMEAMHDTIYAWGAEQWLYFAVIMPVPLGLDRDNVGLPYTWQVLGGRGLFSETTSLGVLCCTAAKVGGIQITLHFSHLASV